MSEVKKISPVGNIYGWEESQFGEFVLSQDYDDLAEEAQALREEVARAEQHRNDQADLIVSLRTEVAALRMARDDFKLERDLARKNFCDEQAANYQLQAHLKACLGELSELRARVVVVPERLTNGDSISRMLREIGCDGDVSYHHAREIWNACIDELSRINGKTVSEGLLRKWLELMEHGDYREGHCMCGSPVDSHGIGDGHAPIDAGEYYAGQVMEELRALLNQDKENGNG
ncbi:hypothetical protein PAERUG_P41_London_28_09_12_02916 [Pseudomonas aeruginosa]|uniref:hypothetical protein n=1 Tax=Pseudomonas aeruginosa TaxID=287 RepID=UPI000658FA18|nr:hypothetical protein [Pseudomonas aeruginosa]CRO63795.1 hypothetical protein PAERUG_P41_London_28_09_12_02916 [Pseudomonas aeruginosa]CRR76917.1 hypothetical protein PAERUG_E15_London_28_01_14_10726 [Pseudomonas aeruginosa]